MSSSERRIRPKQALVRLTDGEHEALSGRAESAGLTLADYIRSQALGAKPLRARVRPAVERAELARILAELGKLGSNVNQIARNLNRDRAEDGQFMADTLSAVQQMRDVVLIALGVDPAGGRP